MLDVIMWLVPLLPLLCVRSALPRRLVLALPRVLEADLFSCTFFVASLQGVISEFPVPTQEACLYFRVIIKLACVFILPARAG
jgi:hypothetical protein